MQLPRFFSGVFSDSVFIIRIHPLNLCCIFMPASFVAYQNWKYMNGCMSLLFICITMNITMTIMSA